MFCPKCGSILIPKKEEDKTILSCSCGYKSEDEGGGKIKERIKGRVSKVDIVEDKEKYETLPKMRAECPKCHNNEAYFWEVQTRAADEPSTKFLKCTKCRNVWRDYN